MPSRSMAAETGGKFVGCLCLIELKFNAQCAGCIFGLFDLKCLERHVGGIPKSGKSRDVGSCLLEQSKLFSGYGRTQRGCSRDVTAGMAERRDQSSTNWIASPNHNDWYRGSSFLSRQRGLCNIRHNHVQLSDGQVRRPDRPASRSFHPTSGIRIECCALQHNQVPEDIVGNGEHARRNGEAECFGGVEVDD